MIDRRTVLKGFGAALALPYLESLSTISYASAPKAPLRTAFIFVPNGINMDFWTPKNSTYELNGILSPLAHLKNSINVISGLAQQNAFPLGDGPGDHARSAAAWLTGCHPKKTNGANIKNGISFDQILANHYTNSTKFSSIELGCERGGLAGDCDSGYSCAYSNSISWRSETTPAAKETDPRLAFERLFKSEYADEDKISREIRIAENKSILDFLNEDAKRLHKKLGKTDQTKLDEYLTGIREIERRISFNEKENNNLGSLNKFLNLQQVPSDYTEHIRLMGDLMVLAFQNDNTRVATFMFANEGSNRSYKMIGVNDGHHEMSHHQRNAEKLEALLKINKYHVEQLAYILDKMNSIKEGDKTLLENSMIVYGAGICDGDRHNHDDLPILLAGNAGGKLGKGKHITVPKNTPMTNLFLSMADKHNIDIEKIGDSTGKLLQVI
jgi:hypothetical protein